MLNNLTPNQLASECHENNKKWWIDLETGLRKDRNKGELLMLVITELAEACEGFRKNLSDDKLPHRKMAEVELVDAVIRLGDFAGAYGLDLDEQWDNARATAHEYADIFPNNPAEQLLWITKEICGIHTGVLVGNYDYAAERLQVALVQIELMAAIHSYDLDGAYVEKTAFNKVRPDHSIEARKAEGGKKF